MDFIKYVEDSTTEYLNQIPKSERKKIGQFFTTSETANYMGSLICKEKEEINILDPGAGSGILSAAILQNLYFSDIVTNINLDLYENNNNIISLLKNNLEYMKGELLKRGKILNFTIYDENFISYNRQDWSENIIGKRYDIAISNPPYLKIGKESAESLIMSDIVYGQPNIYFLFMAMTAHLLKEDGELVFIVPRSFTSGLYFTSFRQYFFKEVKVTNLHLFVSRGDVFNCDNILQETLILKAVKTKTVPKFIKVTESDNSSDFSCLTSFVVPYKTCVKDDKNSFLYLPTKEEDIDILDFVNQWNFSLPEIGFRLKTGLTVNFRNVEWLQFDRTNQSIPLLWCHNIDKNEIIFPVQAEGRQQYIIACNETKSLKMDVGNYVILKRFTSKEEKRRLQCAVLNKNQFSEYTGISTENHLNFITKINGVMKEEEMYGIFLIFNSIIMDKYFRILNGSTQVNANEINSIPLPSYEDIIFLGKELIRAGNLNEKTCNEILENRYAVNAMLRAE